MKNILDKIRETLWSAPVLGRSNLWNRVRGHAAPLGAAALVALTWNLQPATCHAQALGAPSTGSRLSPRIIPLATVCFTNNSTANMISNVVVATNLFLAAPRTHQLAVETIVVCNTNILSMQFTNGFALSLDGVNFPGNAATNNLTTGPSAGTTGVFVLTNFFGAGAPYGWAGSGGFYTNRQIQFVPDTAFDGAASIEWTYSGIAVPGTSTNSTTTNFVTIRLGEVP